MARGALRLAKARPLTPASPSQLAAKTTLMTWPKGQVIHRIHLDRYGPAQFNPGIAGNARFSPIKNEEGAPIPTLYGGTSFDCAAMETVFHDVPFTARLKTLDKARLAGQVHSRLEPRQDLLLVDLSATALRRLGVRRTQLIDTEKDRYPGTRAWAAAFHAALPETQGLCWISRQDDRALALVLFGDRLPDDVLAPVGGQRVLLGSGEALTELTGLADRIGVKLVAGKA
ncbi:RES family NAD+ phosphorylase [Labrys neptuniae]